MSATASNSRGGEFATARRGGLDSFEVQFIKGKRGDRVADAQIAKMLGRSLSTIRSLDPVKPTPTVKPVIVAKGSALARVAEDVAKLHDLHIQDLLGPSLKRRISLARQQAFWEAYQLRTRSGARRFSMPQIGRFFGNRDHTTVMFGIQQHSYRIAPLSAGFPQRNEKPAEKCSKSGMSR